MRSVVRFFSSVKLAIVLIILITLASVLGTFIPQGRTAAEYAARYGGLAGLFATLQLTRLYSSGWYLALLVLFALNLVVCTGVRFGPKWRRAFGPPPAADPQALMAMKVKGRFRLSFPLAAAKEKTVGALRAARYRVAETPTGGRTVLRARKRRLGLFGSDVVHLGLLVILAGGFASGLGGRRAEIGLLEGETADVPQAAYRVRLDKFETIYYPQGGVKDWKSTVTVVENGAPVLTRVVEVNHPLTYRGVSFYQTSYGWDWQKSAFEIEVRKRADPSFAKTLSLKLGERAAVDDADVTHVAVRQFVPDFVLGEGGKVQSRSQEPRNPAALVDAWKGEERVFSGWVFARYPDFGQGHAEGKSPFAFVLKRYEAAPFSVLEAAKDPGVNFIWLGSLFVVAGLFLAFYWPPREITAVLEEAQGKVEVTAGGHAAKSREAFQAEFDGMFENVRRPS
jgi:cytochrome c biogenesis protein